MDLLSKVQSVLDTQKRILDAIGITNKIHVDSGIFVLTIDKYFAKTIRKGFANAHSTNLGTITEIKTDGMVSFVWVENSIKMTKKEIKEYVIKKLNEEV